MFRGEEYQLRPIPRRPLAEDTVREMARRGLERLEEEIRAAQENLARVRHEIEVVSGQMGEGVLLNASRLRLLQLRMEEARWNTALDVLTRAKMRLERVAKMGYAGVVARPVARDELSDRLEDLKRRKQNLEASIKDIISRLKTIDEWMARGEVVYRTPAGEEVRYPISPTVKSSLESEKRSLMRQRSGYFSQLARIDAEIAATRARLRTLRRSA